MKYREIVNNVLKIDMCGSVNEVEKYLLSFPQIYVYRDGYEISNGKLKKPSIYGNVKGNFKKIKGSGHELIIGYTYCDEYNFFITEEEAIEWATKGALSEYNKSNNYKNEQKEKFENICKKLSKEEVNFIVNYLKN